MKSKALGTYKIAKICRVAPITVGRWIEKGKLPFFTTGGGHRRVWEEDLVKFLKSHNYPVPGNLRAAPVAKILIVDDEPPARRTIRRALEKKFPNCQLEEAASGYEAGEKITSMVPSLVILDINLPGFDGFDVCNRIRRDASLRRVKIVAVTGDGGEEIKKKILKAGANAFLAKPFTMDELRKAVEKLLLL